MYEAQLSCGIFWRSACSSHCCRDEAAHADSRVPGQRCLRCTLSLPPSFLGLQSLAGESPPPFISQSCTTCYSLLTIRCLSGSCSTRWQPEPRVFHQLQCTRQPTPLWGPPATGLKQRCLMRVLGHVLSPWYLFSSIFPLLSYTHGKAISTSDSTEIHFSHAGFVPVLAFCNSEQKHKRKQHVMKY